MVDVSPKDVTIRKALAVCQLTFSSTSPAYQTLITRTLTKGDAFEMAKVAGIMAAKKTPDLLPLCHPLMLDYAHIYFSEHPHSHTVKVFC